MDIEIHFFWLFGGTCAVGFISFMFGQVIGYERASQEMMEEIKGIGKKDE